MKIEKILKIETTIEDKILMILSNNIDIVYCGEPAMSVDKFKQAGIEILAWHKREVEKLHLPVVGYNEGRVSFCDCDKPKYVLNEVKQELMCKCGKRYLLAN